VYIEWFLLDNTLMNYLILRAAGALLARPARQWKMWLAALCGGVLAAFSFTAIPLLLTLPGKLLLAFVMGFPFYTETRDLARGFAAVLVSAMLIGGGIYGFVFLTDGSMRSGVLLAAPPLRIVLIGAAACCLLPGIIRKWHRRRRAAHYIYPLRMMHNGITYTFHAFLDTGNALYDPLSGIPVILLSKNHMPQGAARPIPCETAMGKGILYALRPDKLEVFDGSWQEIHAFIAASPAKIRHADALMGLSVFQEKEPAHEITGTG